MRSIYNTEITLLVKNLQNDETSRSLIGVITGPVTDEQLFDLYLKCKQIYKRKLRSQSIRGYTPVDVYYKFGYEVSYSKTKTVQFLEKNL